MATEQAAFGDPSRRSPPWWRTAPFVLAALLALAFGAIAILANRTIDARDRAIALQRHGFEVMRLVNRLEVDIANAETLLAQQSAATPKVPFDRQFAQLWQGAQDRADAFVQASGVSPVERANALALRDSIVNFGHLVRRHGAAPTGRDVSVHLARLHDALEKTIAHEQAELASLDLLVSRSELRVNRINFSYGIFGLGLLSAALLALWFAYGAGRERRFARQLAQAEALRIDGLEDAVRQRTEELQAANSQLRGEIAERARAEQGLRQLEKMEAIAALTGGIAHDFNNMLAVVVNGIELALRQLSRDSASVRQHLDHAMEGASRASILTERLLAFARPAPAQVGDIDVDRLMLNMRSLIESAVDDGIALELDLAAGGHLVLAEQAQLENVILNLAINARDAMDGRGALTITTRPMTLAEGEVGQCEAGPYVCIRVSDDGCGMTADVAERAFEPFFTTKPLGKGTGLGLSQAFGFVRALGGEIDVRSLPGMGTTIGLFLPCNAVATPPMADVPDPAPPELSASPQSNAAQSVAAAAKADSYLLLIVEDDPRVLRSTVAAVEALGHRALPCDQPGKAAQLLVDHPDVAMILSDVLMPGMSGPEMIAALGPLLAARPVLFVTGFAGEDEHAMIEAGVPVLRKPYTIAQLGQAIADALTTAVFCAGVTARSGA